MKEFHNETVNDVRFLQWISLLSPVKFENITELQQYISLQRTKYQQLIELHKPFIVNDSIEDLSPQVFHPLAPGNLNPWVKQQEDSHLIDLINNDVKRTFQDNPFFTCPDVQKSMQRILYIWAKENDTLGYKQGFNDICGICLLVCCDNILTDNFNDLSIGLDIEYNCYFIFNGLLLTGIKDFYDDATHQNDKLIVVGTCEHIFHTLLKQIDIELYDKLFQINLEPHVFLMRWIRLIFAREYSIQNTISIWDAFVKDYFSTKSLRFINYFAISMLLNIKARLIESDVNDCIKLLFNYPNASNVYQIIANTFCLIDKIN